MKRLVAIVMVGAMATAGCTPTLTRGRTKAVQGMGRWDNVAALPPDTPVRVFTSEGRQEGAFVAADGAGLRIRTRHGLVLFPSALVLRVDRLEALPTRGRGHRAIVSAAVGTVAIVGTTMVGSISPGSLGRR